MYGLMREMCKVYVHVYVYMCMYMDMVDMDMDMDIIIGVMNQSPWDLVVRRVQLAFVVCHESQTRLPVRSLIILTKLRRTSSTLQLHTWPASYPTLTIRVVNHQRKPR
jgi:hypothetical protein